MDSIAVLLIHKIISSQNDIENALWPFSPKTPEDARERPWLLTAHYHEASTVPSRNAGWTGLTAGQCISAEKSEALIAA